MENLSRILCAVDFSRPAGAAFGQGLALAKARDAELAVVFAVPANRRFSWRARQRVAHLAELRRMAATQGVRLSVSVQHGESADVILLHANSSNSQVPDLIVLGTPGRRSCDRLRFGSVAERVMHGAPCSTLIVRTSEPPPPAAAHGRPFDRILCAVDFSPASLSGLEHSMRMLRAGGRELRLLHVVSVATPSVPRLAWQFARAEYTQELASDAWRRLRALAPLCPDVHLQVSVGIVSDEIARAAADMSADVVVMGVGPAGIVRRLLDSTTARVLRTVMSPVLAVPAVRAAQISRGDAQLLRPAA